jgi:hypothetical protein
MLSTWRLENIERLRQDAGIDDVDLRKNVGHLSVGDIVHLTVLDTQQVRSGEVIDVRILEIRGPKFRGLVVGAPRSAAFSTELVNQPIAFTNEHIHSVLNHSAK